MSQSSARALTLFQFDCEATLDSVPEPTSTKQRGETFLLKRLNYY